METKRGKTICTLFYMNIHNLNNDLLDFVFFGIHYVLSCLLRPTKKIFFWHEWRVLFILLILRCFIKVLCSALIDKKKQYFRLILSKDDTDTSWIS